MYQLPRKVLQQTIPMPWNLIIYPLTNIEKDKQEGSVSNVERRGLLTIVLNTTKAVVSTIIDHHKANISNKGQAVYLPLRLLPNIQRPKELTSLPLRFRKWIHQSQKRPHHDQWTPSKRYQIFSMAEGK